MGDDVMRKITLGVLSLLASAGLSGSVAAKETIRMAYVLEPSSQASVYAIDNGKVTSDLVDIKIDYLSINAIDAVAATRQYDVVQTAALQIPRGVAQGIPIKAISLTLRYARQSDIISIWVPRDAPYKTMQDLKGKTIGAFGLNSSSLNNIRLAIAKKYGMNVGYDSGDFKWVEVPGTAMVAALQSQRIDAGTFLLSQAYQYGRTGEYRQIMNGNQALIETLGTQLPSGMLIAYNEALDKKPEVYKEVIRTLKASLVYLKVNEDQIFAELGARNKMTGQDVRDGFYSAERTFGMTKEDQRALVLAWQGYKDIGILRDLPPVERLIWAQAVDSN
jgi:NitT/TauT family transport system substrate-binding protein